MRILLAAFGTRGDIQPFLVLASELRRRGHEPVFCTPPDFTAWLGSRGFEAHPAGAGYRALVTENAGNIFGALPALRRDIAEQCRALEPLVRESDFVVASGISAAALPVAEKHGIPYRFTLLSPSLLPSREHPAPHLRPQSWPKWMNAASWSVYEAVWGAVFRAPILRQRRELGLAAPADLWRAFMQPEAFVAADPTLAPAPADAPLPVRQFGGFFFDDPTPIPDDVERFLDAGPAPVYVGFGSMADERPGDTTRMLVDATKRAGVRVLVSRGWAGLEADPTDEIHVVGELSHAKLFPRCAGVVHHGGAGTAHAAARAGVPQLVVPHLLDQFFWASRVKAAGLGLDTIARDRLRPATLGDALRRLVEDGALAAQARAFAKGMIRDGASRAAEAIEEVSRGA